MKIEININCGSNFQKENIKEYLDMTLDVIGAGFEMKHKDNEFKYQIKSNEKS